MMHALLDRSILEQENSMELVQQIFCIVKQETNLGVQDMDVFLENGKMILTGYCRSFHTKQLAQTAVLKIIGDVDLVNRIHVA